MSDVDLPQAEADGLLAMPKVREDDRTWAYPEVGGTVSVPLVSEDKRERSGLDVMRGRLDLRRVKLQTRARQMVILARLETGGPPHRNPDDSEVRCPHMHLYHEGYADKSAFPVPGDLFGDLDDARRTLREFMALCNITRPAEFERGLFL